MNKYTRYFKDSYGWDKLSTYLSIIGLLLMLSKYSSLFGLMLIAAATFRSISKNKYKRYRELQAFEDFSLIFRQRIYRLKQNLYSFRNYKTFKCPNCSQKLRVPRKQGKIVVTCKKCGTEFKKKS
ncbi:putative RNA-binding Zn-ribbon protein involved in translation (DUF1610 family) [Clostridium acetobutylicum]|uniref:Zn-finger containing protein n=1 Tax=Clostridium acetobutylicum (strain ATCC 824 / DSM 792 / JCM 1419 / IAM 19013 / LMG 5710 / NBRC 13948 / NRRL B-527 / VKM B-1787 / 2291 / W) TaxID=272562 RepID=Q97IN1_CLOAB|nr:MULTISPECIES: Zn-finger containing protein [Clostridium]AAK79576.1 Zn-finger containing protein [Clostridium acetobutylicum ATCC 824]ADZ20661.1 Zn-finger containing protein [Clostridium acetobutylicum EA 2018]AEI31892.1 Zn-finger containing protein [Clostridium acetobutylicum DSM 1731]AWV79984.1 hypothetical protein DK921_07715 [Clostridium acetobutylicum]MBC2394029.1 hypothetical protein [Clostridium acetobutylicum]